MKRTQIKARQKTKPKLVIWGASSHAMVVADIVRLRGDYALAGFLDDINPQRRGTDFYGAPVLGGREQLAGLRRCGIRAVIVGIGHNAARLRLSALARAAGLELATAVHPNAMLSASANVGAGTVVKAGAVIDPGVSIGENVIISSCVSIGHNCVLHDGVRTSLGVLVSGEGTVGRATWLATGVVVIDRIRIGEYSLIGTGAVVLNDIPDRVVAYGIPAKVVRSALPDEY